MTLGRPILVVTVAVIICIALLLSFTVSLPAALCFLAGALIGVVSLAAVVLRVRLLTSGGSDCRRARLWTVVLTLPYYVLLATALWAIARYFRTQAQWLLVGYLIILVVFAVQMARERKAKAGTPEADKR